MQPSRCRWQSASASALSSGKNSGFTIEHPPFTIARPRHYMRRARLLALFLDILVCAAPADLAGLLLTGFIWRFVPAWRGAISPIWIAAGAAATAAFLLRDAGG